MDALLVKLRPKMHIYTIKYNLLTKEFIFTLNNKEYPFICLIYNSTYLRIVSLLLLEQIDPRNTILFVNDGRVIMIKRSS